MATKMMSAKGIAHLSTQYLMTLKVETLRKYLTRLQNVVNKRVRRLLARGWNTPATIALMESGGLISFKNIDKTAAEKMAIIGEIKRAAAFLNDRTSSVRGYLKWTKNITTEIGVNYDPATTPREIADAYKIFDKVKELDPVFVMSITSPVLREYINNFVEEIAGRDDDIVKWILDHEDQVYEGIIPSQKEYAEWLLTIPEGKM